jgi:hypothetical protein
MKFVLILLVSFVALTTQNVCEDHARWVLDHKDDPGTGWINYRIDNLVDAINYLTCFEPNVCAPIGIDCDNLPKRNRKTWTLTEDLSGLSLLNAFSIMNVDEPTHGNVNYVNQAQALGEGLIRTEGNKVILSVGKKVVQTQNGLGRNSVRLHSKKRYNGGVFVFDADHIPEGLSVWPAFWLVGSNWPCNGEIDVVEYVNSIDNQSHNSFTLHTSNSCIQDGVPGISNGGTCGASRGGGCIPCGQKGGTCSYTGCGVAQQGSTGGFGFNRNPGLYITEWIMDGEIRIWFLTKDQASSLLKQTVDTSKFPKPLVTFKSCPGSFKDLIMVLNITLCGDWAGNTFPGGLNACKAYLSKENDMNNAYFSINSIKVYE